MNAFNLSRIWFDFAFDNPEIISPNHAAIYFFAIEHCNRLGWKEKFGFPTQMAMDAIGIKKHSTYIRYFNDLVDWGFFKMVQKSTNQYSANIICLASALPKNGKALGKAISKHGEKQSRSMGQSTGKSKRSINKPINQEPLKPLKPNTPNEISDGVVVDEKIESNPDLKIAAFMVEEMPEMEAPTTNQTGEEVEAELWPSFEDFWEAYDKKRGDRDKIRQKWNKLKQQDKEAIMQYIPSYIRAQPDKQYRKDPATFLNNKSWNDEIITRQQPNRTALPTSIPQSGGDFSRLLGKIREGNSIAESISIGNP